MTTVVTANTLPPASRDSWISFLDGEIRNRESRSRYLATMMLPIAGAVYYVLTEIGAWPEDIGALTLASAQLAAFAYLFVIKKIFKSLTDFVTKKGSLPEAGDEHLDLMFLLREKGYPLWTRLYQLPVPIAQIVIIVSSYLLLPFGGDLLKVTLLLVIARYLLSLVTRLGMFLFPSGWLTGIIDWALELVKKSHSGEAVKNVPVQKGEEDDTDAIDHIIGKLKMLYRTLKVLVFAGISWLYYSIVQSAGSTYTTEAKLVLLMFALAAVLSLFQITIHLLFDRSRQIMEQLKYGVMTGEIPDGNWPGIYRLAERMHEYRIFADTSATELSQLMDKRYEFTKPQQKLQVS